jgi:hypothetical protein
MLRVIYDEQAVCAHPASCAGSLGRRLGQPSAEHAEKGCKWLVQIATSLALGCLIVTQAVLHGAAQHGQRLGLSTGASGVARAVLGTGAYRVVVALVGTGIAALVRHAAAAIASVVVLFLFPAAPERTTCPVELRPCQHPPLHRRAADRLVAPGPPSVERHGRFRSDPARVDARSAPSLRRAGSAVSARRTLRAAMRSSVSARCRRRVPSAASRSVGARSRPQGEASCSARRRRRCGGGRRGRQRRRRSLVS